MLYYNSRTKPLKTKAMSLWNDNHGAALKSNPYFLIGRLLLTQASLKIPQGSLSVVWSLLSSLDFLQIPKADLSSTWSPSSSWRRGRSSTAVAILPSRFDFQRSIITFDAFCVSNRSIITFDDLYVTFDLWQATK